jgi:hypothetical protein
VKESVSIPVFGNGDVTDAESCLKMYEQTGCDLVLVGRGSYGNPFIFSEIAAAMAGTPYQKPTLSEKMDTMLYHIRLILQLADGKPPELAIREARKHAAWYISGLHGAAAFRARCYQLQSYAEAEQLEIECVPFPAAVERFPVAEIPEQPQYHLHFLHRRAAVKSSSLPAYRLPLQQRGWYLAVKRQPQTGQVTTGQENNAVQGQPLRAAAPARTGES